MRKHIFIKGLLSCLLIMVFSCRKNDQNFIYDKMNEVSIKTDSTSFAVTQLDSLKIKPQLKESIPGGDSYTYEWKIYPQITVQGQSPVILSTEKELKAKIVLPPNTYNLQYKVTNSKTGVASYMLYRVLVNGAFYEGWMVSNNKDGKAQLSFVRADNALILNPAEAVNHTTYPGHALAAYSAVDYNIALTLFFTDQGVYRFNANDLLQNGTTTSLFPGGKQFNTTPTYALNKLATDQYIVSEGGLYASLGPTFYPAEVLTPYSDRFTGDYLLFPAIISTTQNSTFFYDNKYKRFMQAAYLDRTLEVSPGSAAASFDLSNVGKTMIACDYGAQSYSQDEFYFIMEDQGGRYLYSINGTTPGLKQTIGNSPDIDKASAFASSSVVKHLYYAAGNKIYLYDILANSARLLYTFHAGYTIKDIKMLRSTSKRIVAAVNKGLAGEVYYFDLDNLGNFIGNTYVKKFEGFGEIVHLSYRNP